MSSYGRLQLENPDFEKIEATGDGEDEGAIVPVYSTVSRIPPKAMRRIVTAALDAVAAVEDPLPPNCARGWGSSICGPPWCSCIVPTSSLRTF